MLIRNHIKPILLWAIWLIVVLFTIAFFVCESRAGPRRKAYATQGSGAAALLAGIKSTPAPTPPPIPKAIVLPPKPPITWHIAATAVDTNGLESDFSSEVMFINQYRTNNSITVAWDYTNDFPGTFNVYCGRASRTYTNVISAGTNRQLSFDLIKRLTNLVITVTGSTNFSITNPVASSCFWTGVNLKIAARRF